MTFYSIWMIREKYFDYETKVKKHYLYPSNLFVSEEPYQITTVLGSCISICLFDGDRSIGGMNHFMLPLWNGEGLASAKYGNIAIERLITNMKRLNARVGSMQAKMFGGASLINPKMNIGERNTIMAKEILAQHGIKIHAESTGGIRGRKLEFNTYTGLVRMRYIQRSYPLKHKI